MSREQKRQAVTAFVEYFNKNNERKIAFKDIKKFGAALDLDEVEHVKLGRGGSYINDGGLQGWYWDGEKIAPFQIDYSKSYQNADEYYFIHGLPYHATLPREAKIVFIYWWYSYSDCNGRDEEEEQFTMLTVDWKAWEEKEKKENEQALENLIND